MNRCIHAVVIGNYGAKDRSLRGAAANLERILDAPGVSALLV